jgi:2-methylisocitrate lyase-like PEP mutase family enzyme
MSLQRICKQLPPADGVIAVTQLRELLDAPGLLRLPGVYDALSARLAINAGFDALYMSGFAVSGTLLGQPDIGLVTATEMIERASRISQIAGDHPVVADGDNGYGGPSNVAHLVRAYERAHVACIQLEDQVNPKRCGHMAGKEVVSREDAVMKIRAAVDARSSSDFLIMARTDARATHDLTEALRRAEAFLAAGADILFIEAPKSVEEMVQISDTFAEAPLVANMVEDGQTPWLKPAELAELGFKIVLYPISALLANARTLQNSFDDLYANGKLNSAAPRATLSEFNSMVGLDEFREMEARISE